MNKTAYLHSFLRQAANGYFDVFCGIKGLHCLTREDLEIKGKAMFQIFDVVGEMTPRQFMSLFPVKKEYDGKKWGVKDYYYTMEACNQIGMDNPIGDGFEFLWDYWNDDISDFITDSLDTISTISRQTGGKGLAEVFAETTGVDFYVKGTNAKGNECLFDKKGKAHTIYPNYLRVVK